MTGNVVAPVESPNSEGLSEHQQASLCLAVDPSSGEAPSKEPLALEGHSKDQSTAEGPPKDPTANLLAGEGPPASGNLSENQPTAEGLPEDLEPAEDLTSTPPAEENLSKTPPVRELSTPQWKSPSEGQLATEAQAGDRQTAEGPTTNQQAQKTPEDPPALGSLSNGQFAVESVTIDPSEGEIPKEPTESPSQDQSTAEPPSEDHAMEILPIVKPAAKALPSSGKLSGKIPFITFRVFSNIFQPFP